mmetsp:Transcript_39963/g.110001  ORF Transcript_39963/g.110001 Transcript_39963/m.110001 type:complete len:226 (+) Transcript_39963:178-855(+)
MRDTWVKLTPLGAPPPEGRLRLVRRPRNRVALQSPCQTRIRDLRIHAAVGVWIGFVEVSPGRDGVVRRVALTTVDLVRPLVALHFIAHVSQGGDLRGCAREDMCARVLVRTEESAMDFRCLGGANAVADVLVPSSILRRPVASRLQSSSLVRNMGEPRDLLQDEECSAGELLPRHETVVVHDHPLAAVGASSVAAHKIHPLLARFRKPVREHNAHEIGQRTATVV